MRISDWSSDVCSSDLPAVQEVAVFGIPDAKWGEAVKAVVVAKPGTTVEESDIIAWARERIAPFKAPRSFDDDVGFRSEEHTSELQSLMRISYAVFCLKKKTKIHNSTSTLLDQYNNTL